jgi:hypothetical protein
VEFLMDGFADAQRAYDAMLPPEPAPYGTCVECDDALDEEDDTMCPDCVYALGGHDMTEDS